MLLLDHLLERTGDEDVDRGAVEVFFADGVCFAVPRDAARLEVVLEELVAVDPVVIAQAPGVVHDGDDLGAHVLEDLAAPPVHVTESEQRDLHALDGDADPREHLGEDIRDALPGRLLAALRPAEVRGLARDDADAVVPGLGRTLIM